MQIQIEKNLLFLVLTGRLKFRVEHFVIISRILRILMEHIETKNSLDSKLQTFSICSVRILNILEVIVKRVFLRSQNAQP